MNIKNAKLIYNVKDEDEKNIELLFDNDICDIENINNIVIEL